MPIRADLIVLYYPILTEHRLGILVVRRQEEMGLDFFALGCLDRGMMQNRDETVWNVHITIKVTKMISEFEQHC